jgi:hypothetical protein
MIMSKSIQLSKNLYLNEISLGQKDKQKTAKSVHFIFVCDVSGSMSYDLRLIREQLKNKVSSLLDPKDCLSIIWFSGNSQFGILKSKVKVSNLTELNELHKAIDMLQPMGLTAFANPLDLVNKLAEEDKEYDVKSLIFLTDGYNNDCKWEDVIKNVEKLEKTIDQSVWVEYGNYADTKKIQEMSEIVGGEKIYSESFDSFDFSFSQYLKNSSTASKKTVFNIEKIKSELYRQFLFGISSNQILSFNSSRKNDIMIPENMESLLFLTKNPLFETKEASDSDLYLAIYVLSEKMMYDEVDLIFTQLKDKFLFNMYTNAYGKQKLNSFKSFVFDAIFDETKRFLEGKSDNLVLNKNAYCIIDMIDDLMEEGNLVFTQHPKFNYNRIGVKKVIKSELDQETKNKLAEAKTAEEVRKITSSITVPEFEITDKAKGYPLSSITLNEERANISFLVRYEGKVKLPKNNFGLEEVDSFIYRNYTLIKDGILNLDSLPVTLTDSTKKKLLENGVKMETLENGILLINFGHLPIINRSMVEKISAKELANLEYALIKLQANQKVYGYFDKKFNVKVNKDAVAKHSLEIAEWLRSLSITEWNGFAPKVESSYSGDVYMALCLKTKIEKLSSLPKTEDVLKKLNENKSLTISESLMKSPIDVFTNEQETKLFKSLKNNEQQEALARLVDNLKKEAVTNRRMLMKQIASIKFSLIMSKRWMKEFESFEQNSLVMNFDNTDLKVTFDLSEEEVKM